MLSSSRWRLLVFYGRGIFSLASFFPNHAHQDYWLVVQLAEHLTVNQDVVGSNPT